MLSYTESLADLRSEKKHPSRTPTNAPHLHLCIFSAKQEHKLSSSKPFLQPAVTLAMSQITKFPSCCFIIVQSASGQADNSAAMLLLRPRRCPSLLVTHLNSTYSTHNAVTKDTHPQRWQLMVTLLLSCKLVLSCIQHTSYIERMLCVKWQDPDGDHLVRADGLPRWLRTGYVQTDTYTHTRTHTHGLHHTHTNTHSHTQMATHRVWPGDGGADYWFAQINDSQPGHLTTGGLHPQSWHCGLARRTHTAAAMQGTSQRGLFGSSQTNMSCFYTVWIQTLTVLIIHSVAGAE